jgi:hypothetical protein
LISKFNDGGGSHSVTRYTPSSYVTRLMAVHTRNDGYDGL